MSATEATLETVDVRVTITTSDGDDGAVVVFIDTQFEPDGSDGGPGLRVWINDDPQYEGVLYSKPLYDDWLPPTGEPIDAAYRPIGWGLGPLLPGTRRNWDSVTECYYDRANRRTA